MKNRRRLIIVILSVAILVSISVPVAASALVLVPQNSISRGMFRYYGSGRQEKFSESAMVIGGNAYVRAAWISGGYYTCYGSYYYISRGSTKTIYSGWADHPTSYSPGGVSAYDA